LQKRTKCVHLKSWFEH